MNPRENVLASIRHEEGQWVPCPSVDGSMRVVFHDLTEYPEGPGTDDWGVRWAVGEEETGAGLPEEYPISDPSDIESYPLPDPDRANLMEPAKRALEDIDRDCALVFGDNGWGIFERSWLLVGMERLFLWMHEAPEAVRTLMRRITDVKVRISERFIDEVGVDGIRYGDDWAGESGLMMGPALWRKFIKPQQERLYRVCRDRDRLIFQHSDGHVEQIVHDLVEMGLDVLNPLQPACNDVEAVKRRHGGELAFHGVISSRVLHMGTPDDVRREVRGRVDQLSPGGGYIVAPAHGLAYPEANLHAFRQAAVEYCRVPDEWQVESERARGDVEV